MAILVDGGTKVVVAGITGSEGTFHSLRNRAYGTDVVAGVTPTAGGLIFAGELNGDAIALDAKTGAVLWRQPTRNAIGGGVITYRAGGKQLLAVAAGFKSRVWPVPAESNRIIVFGLP